jgi:excinuclease UvrABC nuclease subunit
MNHVERLPSPPIDIPALARVSFGEFASLPALGGIYLATDEANRVWYVGIADSLRGRFAAHEKLEAFKGKGASTIAFTTEQDAERRRALEKTLIEFFHPPLNLQHNFNSLPAADFGMTPDEEIERFLRLRIKLRLIELELEALKPNIVTRCEQSGGRVEHTLGSITAQRYKTWTFSLETEELRDRLKKAQELEKKNGVAQVKGQSLSPVARISAQALSKSVQILISSFSEGEAQEQRTTGTILN